jgi:hypothetical protein
MEEKFYKLAEQFVTEAFTTLGDPLAIKHLKRTVYWLKLLKPDADGALLIAAVSHDIERGFISNDNLNKFRKSNKGFVDDSLLELHQKKGADIIAKFLEENCADKKLIERVKILVSKHEVGGDKDQNLLKDADSLSFFENNVSHFITKLAGDTGKEKVKSKFEWMFNRISSEKARKIAQPWFEEAIRRLDSS